MKNHKKKFIYPRQAETHHKIVTIYLESMSCDLTTNCARSLRFAAALSCLTTCAKWSNDDADEDEDIFDVMQLTRWEIRFPPTISTWELDFVCCENRSQFSQKLRVSSVTPGKEINLFHFLLEMIIVIVINFFILNINLYYFDMAMTQSSKKSGIQSENIGARKLLPINPYILPKQRREIQALDGQIWFPKNSHQ